MYKPPNESAYLNKKHDKTSNVLIGIVILLVTVGIIAICYFMFQGIDENQAKLNSMHVMKEISIAPSFEVAPVIAEQANMSEYNAESEKFYREAELLKKAGKFKEAIPVYDKSVQAFLGKRKVESMDAIDKMHTASRYEPMADCYEKIGDIQTAIT